MGLAESQFTNTNTNFGTVTFNVTDGYQTINPIDVTVTITGHNSTVDYDGEEHSVSGYDVQISNPLYTADDFTFSGTAEAARTDVGTTKMGLASDQFANTNANFGTVTFNVTNGYQTINPIDVTVTITGHNSTDDYDGTEHSVSGYDVTISNPLYKEADFTFSGAAEAARTDVGTTKIGLSESQFANTNENFGTVTFNVTDGYQTINPIDVTVTITGHNSTVDYDGEEHSVSGYDVQISNPLYTADDFTFSGMAEAARTDVGTTKMGLSESQFANTNENFGTVAYNVTDGYQTINPIDVTVTITGHSSTVDYDGEEHSVSGYDVTISNPLYKEADFTFSGTAEAARTDVGTTKMGLATEQFTNTNTNFGTVTFNVTDGYQTINPIDVTVTITGHNSTDDYNGEEHSVSGYDVSISNPLYKEADFTFSGMAEAKRTDVGTTNMGLASDQFANTNENFGTVTFNVTDGYQTINPIDVTVTITGHNGTNDYDGEEHSVSGYDVQIGNPLYTVADFTFSGTAEAARTDVGTTKMGLASDQFVNTNTNFGTVTFNVTDGYQTINPINVTVTITGHSSTDDYDGTEHSVSDYDVQISNPLYTVADFTFSGTAEAKRTDAGTTDMGLAADQFTNTNTNFGTVTFNVTDGYQTINPINVTVTITGHSSTDDYDGTEHSVSGYDVQISNPLYTSDDFTFSGTAEAKRTDAGTTTMGLAVDQFENKNQNFGKVTFEVTDGHQTIEAIHVVVTITGHHSTEAYDDKEHSVTGYDVQISDPLYKETDFTFSGTATAARTDVGTTYMGLAANQFTNNNANFATVVFEVTDGHLTIEAVDVIVTITGHHSADSYNGQEHSVSGYEVQISDPLYQETDFTFSGTAAAARTDVGTTEMGLAESQFTNINPNFGNVKFEVTDGYQTIEPIDVVVTIQGHFSKHVYDGEEHSVSGYDVQISNPLYTEKDFTFSGTAEAARTDVGTTNMGLKKEQFTNKNMNFGTVTFEVTDGYQTIEPIDVVVTIQGHFSTNVYDGEEHSVSDYDVQISNPLYTEADFDFNGTAEVARTDVGTTNMGLKKEQFTNKNANFGTVTFEVTDGYQTIEPIDVVVTIQGHFSTNVYDGEEHSVSGYDVQISNPLYTEKDFTFSGTAEAARTDVGTTEMGLTESQFTNTNTNFGSVKFNVTDGYQTIEAIDVVVTITGHNSTDAYDSKEHSVSGYEVQISNPLYTEKDFTFSGTAEAARSDVGTTNMGLTESQFTNTNTNFGSVKFNVTDGYQTIEAIDVVVTITGHSSTDAYDSKEHSVTGYEVQISNPLYTEKDFTFSGTAEAKRTDVGTTEMGLTESQFTNTNTNFGSVKFNVTDGYQTIEAIDVVVTITGHNSTDAYDSKEHSVSGYEVQISNPLYKEADFTFSGTAEAARTDVGTTNMGLAESQFTNTNTNFGSVKFNVTDGYQKIVPIDVTVTIVGKSNTTVYDGEEHSVSGYDVQVSNPLYKEAYFTFSGTAEAKRTDADTTDMGLKTEQFTNRNGNFGTVTFNVTDGYQTITPLAVTVTITGTTGNKTFNGEEQKIEGYQVESSSALFTEADIAFSGEAVAKGTDAGTYPMNLSKDQFTCTSANFDVTFSMTDGALTIDPVTDKVTVVIDGHQNGALYSGEEQQVEGYELTITGSDLFKATDVSFSDEAVVKGTDAGTYPMGLTAEQFTNTNKNFTNVVFEVNDGALEIPPRKVTLTSAGAEKAYDGEALTQEEVTVSGDGFAAGEGAAFTFTGSQTLIGTSDNTFTFTLDEGTKAVNYEIETVFGKLKVTGDTPLEGEKTTPEVSTDYALGDEIPFTITVTNISAEALTNMTVNDPSAVIQAGDGYELVNEHEATVDSLAPGETRSLSAVHVVTAEDILAGAYNNEATVKTPDGKTITLSAASDDFEDVQPALSLTNTITNRHEDGTGFGLGEEITYELVVGNTGNVVLHNIKVTDTLTGLEMVIPSLEPGEEIKIGTAYTVTADDILNSTVENTATASADAVGETLVQTVEATAETAVEQSYTLTIRYWLDDQEIYDPYIRTLPYATAYNVASPVKEGYAADLERVEGALTEDTTVDVHYTVLNFKLTIRYRYEDGTTAAKTYERELPFGKEFTVKSPVIEGYEPNNEKIVGTMPARNIVYTVIYVRNDEDIVEPYTEPQGAGGLGLNAGESIE